MKRVIAGIAAAVLMCGMLGGCGGEKSEEIPTLTWYVHGDAQTDVASVMEEVNKITVPEIGAKVDLKFIDQAAFNEKMTMMMAANTEFDICFTGYVNKYKSAVDKGGLLALDEYLEKMPELKNAVPEYLWNAAKYSGHIYAVPNEQIVAYAPHMYTFKDLADKYGLDELNIESLEDAEPYLEKIKQNEPDYYPFRSIYGIGNFNVSNSKHYVESLTSPVYAYYTPDGKVEKIVSKTHDEDFKHAAYKLYDWFRKGYIRPDNASVTDDTQDQNMGRYAVWVEKYKPGILDEMRIKYGKEVVSRPIAKPILYSTPPDAMTGVSRTSKNPEKALKLIRLVNTDKKLYNLICFGIEGKHYNLDSDGRVVYVDNSGYAPKACWKFGNQFNALLLPGQPEDVWEQTRKMNEEAFKSPLAGFSIDTVPIRNDISAYTTVDAEYGIISKGAENPDKYYDEMVNRLDSVGAKKIEEEVLRQYDEWKKGGGGE